MTRLRLALTIVCLVTMSTGCRMATSACGEECGLCAPRSGSVLTGASQELAAEEESYYEPEPARPLELGRSDFEAPIMPRQTIEGQEIEGIIISVEDNKVEEASQPQTLDISDAQPAPSPSETQGWSVKQ
jgi:hypothetical protein